MQNYLVCSSISRRTRSDPSKPSFLALRKRSTAYFASACIIAAALSFSSSASAQHYKKTNLISDIPGLAPTTDPNLVNPWGLSRSSTGPWWVSDNGSGVSTLNDGTGAKIPLVVTIPFAPGAPPPGSPTGTVANTSADFEVTAGKPALFLFATEDGTISAWNPSVDLYNAVIKVNKWNLAVYKGMTLGKRGAANFIYAANFQTGAVDVFDKTFAQITLGHGAFTDPRLPVGYAPFNVENLGGKIAVAFAKQDKNKINELDGPGLGFVTLFDTDGKLLSRLESGLWMNAPWGLVQTPADFGKFSNKTLVGQLGSGQILAFNSATGKFLGRLRNETGRPVTIDGLWALSFGNGAAAGPLNTLYFTAGIEGQVHGLLGTITALMSKDGEDNELVEE